MNSEAPLRVIWSDGAEQIVNVSALDRQVVVKQEN
jgi:hypothetical protein